MKASYLFSAFLLVLISCGGGTEDQESVIPITEEALLEHAPAEEPSVALQNLPANFTPLFTIGDLNEDQKVDSNDLETIRQLLSTGEIGSTPCAVAGDIDGNGEINETDQGLLEAYLEKSSGEEFTLFSQPYLSCSYSKFWVAANYLGLAEYELQLYIPNWAELDISISSGHEEWPIEVGQNDATYDIYLPTEFDQDYFDLRIKVGLKYDYHLYLPIAYLEREKEIVKDSTVVTTPPTPASPPDCPQRGGGCEALLIDYSKKVWFEFDADPIADELPTLGCNLTHITPYMKSIPSPTTVGGFTIYKPSQAEINAARTHNRTEHTAVNNAINAHRTAIGAGKELVIEVLSGHGSPCPGVVGAQSGPSIFRNTFHAGNYGALAQKACGWFTVDISCFSGCTPRLVDGLENLGRGTRGTVNAQNIAFHAPYECTTSFGASSTANAITNGQAGNFASSIGTILHNEVLLRNQDIQNGNPPTDYTRLINVLRNPLTLAPAGRYIDHGYMFCKPNHSHFKTGI
ncbi:dockerin type I domain-containing protein [Echinicola sediminis]